MTKETQYFGAWHREPEVVFKEKGAEPGSPALMLAVLLHLESLQKDHQWKFHVGPANPPLLTPGMKE